MKIKVTEEGAIRTLRKVKGEVMRGSYIDEVYEMAIEALKAQDRPIICPRCGRTFSEAEGREEDR